MLAPPGACISVTTVFAANATLHAPLVLLLVTVQLMPDGELVIVPLPRDIGDALTVNVTGGGTLTAAVNAAETAVTLPELIDALQVAPVQAPL